MQNFSAGDATIADDPHTPDRSRPMKQFLVQRWFLGALVLVMLVGFWQSAALAPLAAWTELRYAIVGSVLFLMALPLEAGAMWQAVGRPVAPLLATVMNLAVVPLLAWAFIGVIGHEVLGPEMTVGLLVAAATPCTLASASVWTRRAGGNDAISLLVTVVTNGLCFLVTPFWVLLTTGQSASIDATPMVIKLATLVVLPMAVAQCLRLARPIAAKATHHRTSLGVLAQLGILSMILLGTVQTGQRLHQIGSARLAGPLLAVILLVVTIHLMTFLAGFVAATRARLPRTDCIAVGFAGSQKTLMVGLQVSMELGVSVIPMVAYHVSQLLVDTLIADRLVVRKKPD